MKVLINTIVDYDNYGNRLQNYALQEVLKKNSKISSVVTLKNYYNDKKSTSIIEIIKNKMLTGNLIEKIMKKIYKVFYKNEHQQRKNNFNSFSKNYISETVNVITKSDEYQDFLKEYDLIVIGSDQVWNYEFPRFSILDFALYADKKKQRVISYAASFGINSIPADMNTMYAKGLGYLDAISVREYAGKDIVKQLIDKDVPVVLDPTLLLDKDDWSVITTNSKISTDHKYVLTYFLGKPTKEEINFIENYASSLNLKIEGLNSIKDVSNWSAGPCEFVRLFEQAEAIFTDSFHACVFSIIYEKYFLVFERHSKHKSMTSRIDTLLNKFNITDRWYKPGSKPQNIDYIEIREILAEERRKSLTFLENNLK